MVARRIGVGFLAGASSLLGMLAILMLILLGGGLFDLIHELAINSTIKVHGDVSFWGSLGQTVIQSFQAMPGFFWTARWGIFGLGVLGLLLGGVDYLRPRIQRPWRDTIGFVVTIGVVSAIVFAVQFAYSDTLFGWVADQPDLFNQQTAVLISDTTMILTAALVAVALAYLIWAAWHWWYGHWSTWLRLPSAVPPEVEEMPAQRSEWQEYQERQMRLRRTTEEQPQAQAPSVPAPSVPAPRSALLKAFAALAVATLLAYILLNQYHTVGAGIISGQVWVTSTAPQALVDFTFPKKPQRVTLSNTNGKGVVAAVVRGTDATPLRHLDNVPLSGTSTSFKTTSLDLQGLAPGTYHLTLDLRSGSGGLLLLVGLYGGGADAQLISIAFGIIVGLWFSVATVTVLELLALRARSRG